MVQSLCLDGQPSGIFSWDLLAAASVGAPPLPLLLDVGASPVQLWALAAGLSVSRVANPSAFHTEQAKLIDGIP